MILDQRGSLAMAQLIRNAKNYKRRKSSVSKEPQADRAILTNGAAGTADTEQSSHRLFSQVRGCLRPRALG